MQDEKNFYIGVYAMLDLKVGESCKISLYDKIQRKTKKEMIKLLEDYGFVRAMHSYSGKDDYWTVPALLDYRAPIEIGTKYIYISRDISIFPNKILDEENPKYGQVTIATETNNWKPNQWDLYWPSNEKREFKAVDEDFLCGYAKRLNRFKKELDLTLLSLNAEAENENG